MQCNLLKMWKYPFKNAINKNVKNTMQINEQRKRSRGWPLLGCIASMKWPWFLWWGVAPSPYDFLLLMKCILLDLRVFSTLMHLPLPPPHKDGSIFLSISHIVNHQHQSLHQGLQSLCTTNIPCLQASKHQRIPPQSIWQLVLQNSTRFLICLPTFSSFFSSFCLQLRISSGI